LGGIKNFDGITVTCSCCRVVCPELDGAAGEPDTPGRDRAVDAVEGVLETPLGDGGDTGRIGLLGGLTGTEPGVDGGGGVGPPTMGRLGGAESNIEDEEC